MVWESGVGNMAQLYTVVKYRSEEHQEIPKKVLDYLAEQDFTNGLM